MNDPTLVLGLVVGLVAVALLEGLIRRREALRYRLRLIAKAYAWFGLVAFVVVYMTNDQPFALFAGFVVALAFMFVAPRRSRHIPRAVRKRVIARWESETGRKFNPREWEIDHVIPFSQGGSSTEDNLRVVRRRQNRNSRA